MKQSEYVAVGHDASSLSVDLSSCHTGRVDEKKRDAARTADVIEYSPHHYCDYYYYDYYHYNYYSYYYYYDYYCHDYSYHYYCYYC